MEGINSRDEKIMLLFLDDPTFLPEGITAVIAGEKDIEFADRVTKAHEELWAFRGTPREHQ